MPDLVWMGLEEGPCSLKGLAELPNSNEENQLLTSRPCVISWALALLEHLDCSLPGSDLSRSVASPN